MPHVHGIIQYCLSVTGLFYSAYCPQDLSLLQPVLEFHVFLRLE